MIKSERIPIVGNENFHKSYFKHPSGKASVPAGRESYFEIQRKCIWRDNISAHRLDFYMVFLVTEGEGLQTFGIREHYIRKNMLCFVGPDMISSWQSQSNLHEGYFCTFSDEFVNAGSDNKHFLHQLPFFHIDGNAVLHLTDEQTKYYVTLFKLMHEEFENKTPYSGAILRSQLMVVLNKAYAQLKSDERGCPPLNHTGIALLKRFTALYLHDFSAIRSGKTIQLRRISEYADELGVSQNHLNDTIKSITGRSAGQLIKNQLIRQATMCLMHSSKSISEISYRLGFEDPSYFARFYKTQTGRSPSEFKLTRRL